MKRLLLPLILLLAFALRVLWLDKYPSGFTPDEASFGYDAYSILKTGKDQWGRPFPLVLESFGDFKSPLYAYLAIPSVALFGLTKFAVRLPNAILGSLAVIAVYFLAEELFRSKKAGIAASLLLAISPWHVQLSRGAFEANLTTFFLPLGVYLFLRGLGDRRYLNLAAFVFGINIFSYHSAKLVTPLVVLALLFIYRRELEFTTSLRSVVAKIGLPALIFLLFTLASLYTFTQGAGARASERSITAGALEEAFTERSRSSSFFHNKYTVIAERFFRNYVTYFSPQFFFTEGPKEGTYGMIPGRGVLFWFVIPFFFGIRKLFYGVDGYSTGKYKREILFLMLWVLISAIPASLATGVGHHANRAAAAMPALEIALALGAVEFLSWLKAKKVFLYAFYSFALLVFIYFIEDYFVQSPYKIGKDMLYGNLEAAYWVKENVPTERKVIVSKSLSEPHIYFAFAGKFDPEKYQQETKLWNYRDYNVSWVDQIPSYNLGRFTFSSIKDARGGEILVGRPDEFPADAAPLKTIYYPDGKPAIIIVDSGSTIYATR